MLTVQPNPSSKQALSVDNQQNQVFNPAQAYVLTLSPGQSRQKMIRVLNLVARWFRYANLNECPWEQLTYDSVLAYRTRQVDAGLSAATVNMHLSAIRMVAKQAWLKHMMPIENYGAIKEVKAVCGSRLPHGRALSKSETRDLIEASESKGTAIGFRDAAIMALSVACGLRRSEIAGLTFKNVHVKNQTLSVIGKGNKERLVAPHPLAWEKLQTWLSVRGTEGCASLFVAVKKTNNIQVNWPLTADAIYQILRIRARETGVDAFSPHDLRRTFATRLLERGTDINTVRQAMGHASVLTTQKYDKRDQSVVNEAMRDVDL